MSRPRLVLGLAGTVDYEVAWDAGVLEQLVRRHGIHCDELTLDRTIETERDLVATIVAFLAAGAGGERYVASSAIIERFAARFDKRITLGGTPVRAALAMHALGVTSHLHLVSIDDHVRRLLPEGCTYTCSASADTTDPHLIIQFPAGARLSAGDLDLTAPHANRLIFANDPPARELLLSEDLGAALSGAEVFLISGFNVIQDPAVLARRLAELHRHLRSLPAGALVFYEDAGFHAPALSRQACDALRGVVDVHSMNEDEMQAHLGRSVDLLDADQVEGAVRELAEGLAGPTVLVHTKYWALAVGRDAPVYAAALRGGITMATTRYVHGDHFTEADYDATDRLPDHPDGARVAGLLGERLGDSVCCLPAIRVEAADPTTIGLGDTFVGGFIAAWARTA
ncbi:MAG: ADP-dependent glucokinase/phosphofructokinase [Actinomycetota bacterium]|nr:ADP-dependent glucokinase/phosphofructokinase [Actinomycetota bacterium]